jgi:uracil-DNA glycosylase family 4
VENKFITSKILDGQIQIYENCDKCLLKIYRNKVVYGQGNPYSNLLIIGEAPGKEEDEKGLPFVGSSGKLLRDTYCRVTGTNIVSTSYITNVVCCRPPNNRVPYLDEIKICRTRLFILIKTINPKIVLLLGGTAAKNVGGVYPITEWRGKKTESVLVSGEKRRTVVFNSISTYHPAYLLRNSNNKELFGQFDSDIKLAFEEAYGEKEI